MPWTPSEAHNFKEGLTEAQAEKWAEIANSYLENCDKDQETCEAEAIQTANSQVGDSKMDNKVLRVDQGRIKEKKYDEENEVLTTRVDITKAQVLEYMGPDGSIQRELLPPGELSKSDWLNTIPNKPVTDQHPPDMVNMENVSKYGRGVLHLDPSYKDGIVSVKETITDEPLIQDILNEKKVEVSIGRWTKLVEETGEFDGQKYDYKQTELELNHLAHVEEGRAGSEIKAQLDSTKNDQRIATVRVDGSKIVNTDKSQDNGGPGIPVKNTKSNDGSDHTMKLMIGDKEIELDVGEDQEDAVEEFQDEIDARLNELKDKDDELEDKEDEIESLKDEKAKLEAKMDSDDGEKNDGLTKEEVKEIVNEEREGIIDSVEEKLDVVNKIQKVDEDYDPDWNKSVADLKQDFLERFTDKDLDEKRDAYIEVRFDMLIEDLEDAKSRPTGENLVKGDEGSEVDDEIQEKADSAIHQYDGKGSE